MTWCVWAIDCGEYHLALQIADYAVFHDLRLPEPFTRTLGTLLAEEFADQAKAAQAVRDYCVNWACYWLKSTLNKHWHI